jgi:hypothetical protein
MGRIKSNGPLGRGMGAPRIENDFQQFKQLWAILEAVIVLFAPMLMHLLQHILFLSLSYVNHVYKPAQRDWNFPCSLFSLASCDTSSSTSIGSLASMVVPVSISSSDQGFSFSDVVKNYIFGWFFSDLAFLGGILLSFDSFCYNRDPSMKNTEYRTIIRLVFFFPWLRSRDETKIKNHSKQNKYADPGYRCTMYHWMDHTWR